MWNRKREEENPTRPATPTPAATPVSPQPVREPQAPVASSMPMRSHDAPVATHSGAPAVIGKGVSIKGQIFSKEDLVIDGEIEGTVEAHDHRVTVGPNGRVQAGIKSREIVAQGTINGNVEATDKIDIKKDARLVGDIKTARIVIEDGAYFKGNIDIVKTERPAATPAPKTQASAPAATHAGNSAAAASAGDHK